MEIELVGAGDAEILERVGALLREAGATESAGTPKVFRALGLDLSVEAKSSGAAATPLDRVLATMRRQLGPSARTIPALGSARIPRSFIRCGSPCGACAPSSGPLGSMFAPKPIKALREELAWLGSMLGGRP